MKEADRLWLEERCRLLAAEAGVSFEGLADRTTMVDAVFSRGDRVYRYPLMPEWIERRFEGWAAPLQMHLTGWGRKGRGA